MNRSMLIGIIAGVAVAIGGGVAAFSLMGQSASEEEQVGAELDTAPAEAAKVQSSSQSPQTTTAAVTAAPAKPQPTVAAQECWEEEVEVQAEPKDDKAIAGTAAGALIGGALADRLGDDDDLVTAAGAAAGAFIGRKAQRQYQENRTTTTTVTRCAPQ